MLTSKTRRNALTAGAVLVAALSAHAGPAFADYIICGSQDVAGSRLKRSSGTVTFRAHPNTYSSNGLPSGTPNSRYDNLVAAVTEWNQLKGSALNISVQFDDSTQWDDLDEVGYFTRSPNGGVMNTTAYTYTFPAGWTCGNQACCTDASGTRVATLAGVQIMTHTEIDERTPITWDEDRAEPVVTNADTWGGVLSGQSWMAAMQHEVGHALGLMHSNDGMARMESHLPNGGWLTQPAQFAVAFVPFARDAYDVNKLYPDNTTGASKYATQFWSSLIPFNGDNVDSTFLVATDVTYSQATGRVINYTKYPERVNGALPGRGANVVRPGDQFRARVCFGNRGPTSATVKREVLLGSTVIETTNNLANDAFTTSCSVRTLTVPTGTANGSYTIKYRLDGGTGQSESSVNRRLTVCSGC